MPFDLYVAVVGFGDCGVGGGVAGGNVVAAWIAGVGV